MRRRRSGMALMTAMAMLAFVATAIALMTTLFAADARRTRAAAVGGQLRELLQAGAIVAREQAGEMDRPAETVVATPVHGATLRVMWGEGAEARIEATLHDQRARQVVRFEADGGRWRMVEARLGRRAPLRGSR